MQVEAGNLATSAAVLQWRTGKRTTINPRTRLVVLFFFTTVCVSCCSLSGPMCVACQTTAAHRHVVWSGQGKASGAHVERNVLVQLQTWQPGAPLLLHPDRWSRHNWRSLVQIKLPKKRNNLPARRRTSSRPLRKHSAESKILATRSFSGNTFT